MWKAALGEAEPPTEDGRQGRERALSGVGPGTLWVGGVWG